MSSYPGKRAQRLPSYDYSSVGSYFITLCVEHRLPLLGHIVSGHMRRSPAGQMIADTWWEIPDRYPGCDLDSLMVMPDHFHAIVSLSGDADAVPQIVHHLKSRTTARYALGVREQGWRPFPGRLWQRGFYDRVIRDDAELQRTREYMLQNPMRWELRKG